MLIRLPNLTMPAMAGLLVACNTVPVVPPEDARAFALERTSVWSGGHLEVVIRKAEGPQAIPTVTLDGGDLTVTAVDDTTFRAALPVRTGDFPVEVQGDGIPPLSAVVALHGVVSSRLGPAVGGAVVAREVAGGHVILGSTYEGAAEVSLANGAVLRTWPSAMQDVRCSGGIVPGPVEGQVVVRGGGGTGVPHDCDGAIEPRPYDAAGLGAPTAPGVSTYLITIGLNAILGPSTFVAATQDQWATVYRCDVPWENCHILADGVYGNLVGYEASYRAKRIIPLSRRAALHDLETGDVVAQLPDDPPQYYTSAAFSASGDTVYTTSGGGLGVYDGTTGTILTLDARTGAVLDVLEVADGLPVAVAVDDAGGRILAVVYNSAEARLWMRVYSRSGHAPVADLPVDDPSIYQAVRFHYHHRLVVDSLRREVTLVSTARVRWFQNSPIAPMAIVRWNLAD